MSKPRQVEVGRTVICSETYGVTSVSTKGGNARSARSRPCEQCPWREDVPTGVFPPAAFITSAPTAYDGAISTFGCHMNPVENPATCAGFLLRHGVNNLGVRLAIISDRLDLDRISAAKLPIYESYREMAIANGVDPNDPCLKDVRGDQDFWDVYTRGWKRHE